MKLNFDFEAPVTEIEKILEKLKSITGENNEFDDQIKALESKVHTHRQELYSNLSAWQTVQIARHPKRPILSDYINTIFTDFVELHGDRAFGDDRALIGGFAKLGDNKVMLIGHNKGKNVQENVERNFGQAKPEGYRKALRLMKLAERFNVPIITMIDTQGAYPGIDAEERGQAEAIARNLVEMSQLRVPIVCLVTGEGGSGGALGISVGDAILMLSHSIYSVISPEGCASILWRDGKEAPRAAEALKLTASSLLEMGIIEEIIDEPVGGAHNDPEATSAEVKSVLLKYLKSLSKTSGTKLVNKRFEKYSKIGKFNK